jgi:hypothetical protein
MIPASSGDQAMKVILFLCMCQFAVRYLMVPGNAYRVPSPDARSYWTS